MKIRSIERIPVESSSLVSAGYDPASETLEVEFRTGIYQYVGVPTDRYEGLMAAESKGAYFNQFIRDAGYPFLKIG